MSTSASGRRSPRSMPRCTTRATSLRRACTTDARNGSPRRGLVAIWESSARTTGPNVVSRIARSALSVQLASSARVVQRGIERGDLRPDADVDIATELLVGPVYFRLVFGGELDDSLVVQVADAVLEAFAVRR